MSTHTRRLSEQAKTEISRAIGSYLNRYLIVSKDEPDTASILAIYRASLQSEEAVVWDALRAWWRSGEYKPAMITREVLGVTCRLSTGPLFTVQLQEDMFKGELAHLMSPTRSGRVVELRNTLQPDALESFETWAMGKIHRAALTYSVYQTLTRLVEISNTAGQLFRMCPDLTRYCSVGTKEALNQQERRSPLPPEWMDIPRRKIQEAVNHLALCYLIPSERTWYTETVCLLDPQTWAFDKTGCPMGSPCLLTDVPNDAELWTYDPIAEAWVNLP